MVAVFSPVYFKHLTVRDLSKHIPLIFEKVEHGSFDVVSNSSQITPTPTSSQNSRENSEWL